VELVISLSLPQLPFFLQLHLITSTLCPRILCRPTSNLQLDIAKSEGSDICVVATMAPSNDDGDPTDSTLYLIRHIVLPPRLPHTDDRKRSKDRLLLETCHLALQDLKAVVNEDQSSSVDKAVDLIANLKRPRDKDGNINEIDLHMLLNKLTNNASERVVALELKAQNAALLLSRSDDYIIFEAFELSPTNEASMKSGRLKRTFPSLASRIPISQMNETGLKKTLASTIAKLSSQVALGSQPKVHKASCDHDEPRDTTNPHLLTDWFMNVTAALGEPTDVVGIVKNTREEVLWQAKQPWRRSPLWLLIRVSLQLLFIRQRN
jgi:hypothetical protein